MNQLYFIRHGQSVMNAQGLLAGSTDTPLTDTGREQARAAGVAARRLSINHIITSPLSRARETAEIIAREINYPLSAITFDKRLVERHFGEKEGAVWEYGIDLSGTKGLETIEQFRERLKLSLADITVRTDDTILIVAHGAVYRMLRELTQPDYTFSNITVKSNNAELIRLL